MGMGVGINGIENRAAGVGGNMLMAVGAAGQVGNTNGGIRVGM